MAMLLVRFMDPFAGDAKTFNDNDIRTHEMLRMYLVSHATGHPGGELLTANDLRRHRWN
jgi:hypothetical protein